MRSILIAGVICFCFGSTYALVQTGGVKTSDAPAVQLTDEEQHDMQSILDVRTTREREYREAALQAQAAQARYEAASNAALGNFFKLCAKHRLDPDKFELSSDGKAIIPKQKKQSSEAEKK